MSSYLFAIVILVPKVNNKGISDILRRFNKEFSCESALYFPIHITLSYDVGSHYETLIGIIESVTKTFKPFVLDTDGIGSFDNDKWATNPYVVYIKINESTNLNELRKLIIKKFREKNVKFRNMELFNPHITLAHDDLKKEDFEAAINIAKRMHKDFKFEVNGIAILKQENDGRWIVEKNIAFNKKNE